VAHSANGADPITPGISYPITGITGIIGGFNISPTTPIAYNSASNLIQISNPYDSTLPFWTDSDSFSFSTNDPSTSSWIIFFQTLVFSMYLILTILPT
jgi:hypothetical protein